MPIYEYYCTTCDDGFEIMKPMATMTLEAVCPEGHGGAQKSLSMFASVIKADGCASPSSLPTSPCQPNGCACCN